MIELKKSAVLCFDGGTLTINRDGFGDDNGRGYFAFDEDNVEWVPHDERAGCYLQFALAPSEMAELRDWLNKQLEGSL
jgi:hypothetical protein